MVGARLDAIGVFGYSDEEGTEAATADGKLPESEIRARVEHVTALAEELTAQRAEDRVGEAFEVLVESVDEGMLSKGALPIRPPRWMARPRCPALPLQSATSFTLAWLRPMASISSVPWRCQAPRSVAGIWRTS